MLEQLNKCRLCPRNCSVNRNAGELGYCRAGVTIKAGRAALHQWEEPCLSGSRGSGTVFFTYCTLQCVYCQNAQISQQTAGKEITVSRLAEIFLELQARGAHNINLVTPTHYTPQIIEALKTAKKNGLVLPVIYNTSGYESVETLQCLKGYVDIYLPDFKYFSPALARRYSHAPDYPEVAKAALEEMISQTGQAIFDNDGMMQKGVIVRHLVLPGCEEDSKRILDYLYSHYGDTIYISLMNQYTPFAAVKNYPEINCRVSQQVYERLIDYAADLGIQNGFVQEDGTAQESFIPSFHGEGL